MKSPTNLRTPPTAASQLRSLFSGKRPLVLVIALVAVAGGYGLWKFATTSHQPWLVRWRVQRYLKQQAHTGNFKVDFAFPSKAEMAKAPPKKDSPPELTKGPRTGKDYETLRSEFFPLKTAAVTLDREIALGEAGLKEGTAQLDALTKQLADAATSNASELQSNMTGLRERMAELQKKIPARSDLQAKEEALAPIVSDLWEFQRAWLAETETSGATNATSLVQARAQLNADIRQKLERADSYGEMYRLIGQEMWVAGRLLDSANPEHRRAGVTIALNASRHALNDAQNGWVAARICEGYVLPHLDLADDPNRRSPFNPENLLSECADIFRRNNEYDNVARTYESFLARAGTPQRADLARSQLSMAYEQAGDPKRALQYLRQIQNTNDYRWVLRRITRLEQQLKNK